MKIKLLPFLLLSPFALQAADWPQYRGVTGDGISPELLKWKPTGLSTVWKAESVGGFSSFTVSEGRAFTLALKEVDGASQEVITAHDASTGKEIWSAALAVANYDKGGNDGTPENKAGMGLARRRRWLESPWWFLIRNLRCAVSMPPPESPGGLLI